MAHINLRNISTVRCSSATVVQTPVDMAAVSTANHQHNHNRCAWQQIQNAAPKLRTFEKRCIARTLCTVCTGINTIIKYMRRTAGYTRTDYKTNTQIANELKITPILDKLLEYKRNWIQHVNRMSRNRLPRVMKDYSPTGKRNHGRPLKRHLVTWDRNGSTSDRTPWQIYDDDNDDDDDDNSVALVRKRTTPTERPLQVGEVSANFCG